MDSVDEVSEIKKDSWRLDKFKITNRFHGFRFSVTFKETGDPKLVEKFQNLQREFANFVR